MTIDNNEAPRINYYGVGINSKAWTALNMVANSLDVDYKLLDIVQGVRDLVDRSKETEKVLVKAQLDLAMLIGSELGLSTDVNVEAGLSTLEELAQLTGEEPLIFWNGLVINLLELDLDRE